MNYFVKELGGAGGATLTGYALALPEGETRPAVLVLPGGGYAMCSDAEGKPIALAYNGAGMHAFVLRYTVGKDMRWPAPLNDYLLAMRYLRVHAKELCIAEGQIAVIGFSAGGHLACAAALCEERPDAVLLGYAALTEDTWRLLGRDVPDIPSAVDAHFPPAFLFATRTDGLVPVENTLRMAEALEKREIPFECHICSFGAHGFALAEKQSEPCSDRVSAWFQDSVGWLKEVFSEKRRLMEVSLSARLQPKQAGAYSIDDPLCCLFADARVRSVILQAIPEFASVQERLLRMAGNKSLRFMLGQIGKEPLCEELDGALHALAAQQN